MSLRTTFPLDRDELRRRKRKRAFSSPATMLPGLAFFIPVLVTAFSQVGLRISPVGLLVGAVAAGATALGLWIYWHSKNDKLEDEVVRRLIAESNSEQDRSIRHSIVKFRRGGFHNYAATLGRFLICKQQIEKKLYAGTLTPKKEEVDTLVDTITFNVRDQLSQVIRIESAMSNVLVSRDAQELIDTDNIRRRLLTQVVHAYATLQETYEHLDTIIEPDAFAVQPPPLPEPEENEQLQDAIDKLRDEAEVARKVQEFLRDPLLHDPLAADLSPPLPPGIVDDSDDDFLRELEGR